MKGVLSMSRLTLINLSACCYDDMKNLEATSEFDYKMDNL